MLRLHGATVPLHSPETSRAQSCVLLKPEALNPKPKYFMSQASTKETGGLQVAPGAPARVGGDKREARRMHMVSGLTIPDKKAKEGIPGLFVFGIAVLQFQDRVSSQVKIV